jgi:transcriptional regulator with XRE-family HTH domain
LLGAAVRRPAASAKKKGATGEHGFPREASEAKRPARGLKIATFAEVLDGVSASTLRAAVSGDAAPSPRLIEECARFLRVRPEYFREYRVELRRAA